MPITLIPERHGEARGVDDGYFPVVDEVVGSNPTRRGNLAVAQRPERVSYRFRLFPRLAVPTAIHDQRGNMVLAA
jgi:hypothetical protein